jgi:photosystem II stability/assembly factor-like uncharacterized protein
VKSIIFVCVFVFGSAAAADWYWLNPLPTANNLTSVWFVGDTGYISGASTFRTTDAGAHWTTVASYEFEEMQFPVNGNVGYGTGSGIAKTTDAGATWAYTRLGDYYPAHQVCFPAGNDTGFVTFSTDPPRLARTCDGFATHTEMFLNGVSRTNGMAFTDTRHGWIVGGSGGLYGGFILRTTDGGATWARQDSGYAMGRRCGVCALGDGQTAFACGYESLMMKTTDGGEHWDGLPFPDEDEVSEVCFPGGPDTGFALATNDRVYRTVDGGQTWDSCPGTEYADAMHFPDGVAIGCAVGWSGMLARTTDAGATWSSMTRRAAGTLSNTSLMDVDFPADEATGFAVGSDGAFIKTTDGGQSWFQPCVLDTFCCQWDGVDFLPDRLTGFICGTAGINNNAVLRTHDGGVSWDTVLVRTGGTGYFRDVLFPFGDDTGYVVDRAGRAVWKTTDCGDSWVRHGVPIGGYLNALAFPARAVGYVVGTGGDVGKTTDAGETWLDVSTIFNDDLYGVEFPVGTDTGWVCGSYGRICRTNDGGATWEMQNAPQEFFWSIRFPAGTQLGFCCGEGVMMTTTDGGVTWISNMSLTTQDLWSMQFPLNAGTGYVVGSGGTILKTGFGGGVEETSDASRSTRNAGATVVSGAAGLKHDAASVIYDATGRRVTNPGPGVYFVREQGRVRKVVVAR